MEKIKCSTEDLASENAAKLIRLFPEVADEAGGVNLDKLRQVLSSQVIEGNVERYEFTWPGKRAAMAAASAATTKTLRPCLAESAGRDGTPGKFDSQNLYIEGDNLEVLKILQRDYADRVKMIYIDPPYNTGHDFVYRDRFSLTQKEIEDEAGLFDEDGNRFEVNDSAEARYHSNWCSMMYPRLKLARNLLRDDGVIFISIDDNEVTNLRKLCDEIFGVSQFVNIVSILAKNTAGASGGGEDRRLKKNVEYLVIYAKQYQIFAPFKGVYEYTELSSLIARYKEEGVSWKYNSVLVDPGKKEYIGSTTDGEGDEIKVYRRSGVLVKSISQLATEYGISEKDAYKKYGCNVFDTTNAQTSIRDRVIDFRVANKIADDVISIEYVPRSGRHKGQIYEQFYKGEKCRLFVWLRDTSEERDGILYKRDMLGTLWDVSGEMKNLTKEGGIPFANGKKPVLLLTNILKMQTEADDLVLDFFSGSATTAHAVMKLNAEEDGGNRKFIMVQLPEPCDEGSEAAKAGYKNICEIGKERIRRAGKKILDEIAAKNAEIAKENAQGRLALDNTVNPVEKTPPDIGFRVLKLDTSSLNDTSATVGDTTQEFENFDRIKSDRKPEDLLFQLLVETRIPLSDPIAKVKIGGNKVFFVGVDGGGAVAMQNAPLAACLDPKAKLTNEFFIELAKLTPGIVFFRDDAFVDDSARVNVEQIFAQFSPTTSIKVI